MPAHRKNATFRQALIVAALAAISVATPVKPASAAGLLELLFGGFRDRSAPSAPAFADPFGLTDPGERPAAAERGPSMAYCVRLCDGYHFPVQRSGGMSAAQACNSFCPAAKTKVFSGSSIDSASASDGTRYADLSNASVRRQQTAESCTCNGKTSFGLAAIDVNDDPTLRPGDIVATNNGFVAYKGGKKQGAEFSPIPPDARRKLENVKVIPPRSTVAQIEASKIDLSAQDRDDARRAQLSR